LAVIADGTLRVSSALSVSRSALERLILSKEDWIESVLSSRKERPCRRLPAAREDYLRSREAAREAIAARLAFFAPVLGVSPGRVSIRNQRSRWGSCSRRGNLNFSFKLLFLPPELADYVVVHELCHLREPNHSPAFWALLASVLPDCQERRRALRSYS
jgi:predicted metal-dependent hydrolase